MVSGNPDIAHLDLGAFVNNERDLHGIATREFAHRSPARSRTAAHARPEFFQDNFSPLDLGGIKRALLSQIQFLSL